MEEEKGKYSECHDEEKHESLGPGGSQRLLASLVMLLEVRRQGEQGLVDLAAAGALVSRATVVHVQVSLELFVGAEESRARAPEADARTPVTAQVSRVGVTRFKGPPTKRAPKRGPAVVQTAPVEQQGRRGRKRLEAPGALKWPLARVASLVDEEVLLAAEHPVAAEACEAARVVPLAERQRLPQARYCRGQQAGGLHPAERSWRRRGTQVGVRRRWNFLSRRLTGSHCVGGHRR